MAASSFEENLLDQRDEILTENGQTAVDSIQTATTTLQEPLVCRDAFYRRLDEHFASVEHRLRKPWSRERLQKAIDVFRQVRDNKDFKKTQAHHYLIRCRQLLETENGEAQVIFKPQLGRPQAGQRKVGRAVVAYEDIYDRVHDVHLKLGHIRRKKLWKAVSNNCLIPLMCTDVFVELCRVCSARGRASGSTRKRKRDEDTICSAAEDIDQTENRVDHAIDEPPEEGVSGIGQVDVVDMGNMPDGEYKFLLRYEEKGTQFLVLRPLKSNTYAAIAAKLLKIFLLLGAPPVLQSRSGGFVLIDRLLSILLRQWPSCKLLNGHGSRVRADPSFHVVAEDLQKLLRDWVRMKANPNWSRGCHFVQWQKNNSVQSSLQRSPYEATFGTMLECGQRNMPPAKKPKPPKVRKSRAKMAIGETRNKCQSLFRSVDSEHEAQATGSTVKTPLARKRSPVALNSEASEVDVDLVADSRVPRPGDLNGRNVANHTPLKKPFKRRRPLPAILGDRSSGAVVVLNADSQDPMSRVLESKTMTRKSQKRPVFKVKRPVQEPRERKKPAPMTINAKAATEFINALKRVMNAGNIDTITPKKHLEMDHCYCMPVGGTTNS